LDAAGTACAKEPFKPLVPKRQDHVANVTV
jgi:hypothetical protein